MNERIALKFIRFYFRITSRIAPKIAAKQALSLFQKIRNKSIRKRETPFYSSFDYFEIPHDKEPIRVYHSSEKRDKNAILVHGWDSNPGCMLQIIQEITNLGYGVFIYNLPSHGKMKATHTNLIECRKGFNIILDHLDSTPDVVVSHSFGSAVISYALANSDHYIKQIYMLSTPNKVYDIFTEFKELIDLKENAFNKFLELSAEISKEPIEKLTVSKKLNDANFDSLVLIHDENDKILPFDNSLQIHKEHSNSKLIRFQNIGHYKMLWNEDVTKALVNSLL